MNYTQANQLNFNPRTQMSQILVEGFWDILFSKFKVEKAKLINALEHCFDLSVFYVAHDESQIYSIVANSPTGTCFQLDKKLLQKKLGFISGWIVYKVCTTHLHTNYPAVDNTTYNYIDLVVSSPNSLQKGVTYGLMQHIVTQSNNKNFMLLVQANNTPAVRLYEKVGFRENSRKKSKVPGAKFDLFLTYNV
ncbi:MAG: GNAT family N-acetyltransferase [Streptococcaceae bacterium]|jgi:ribosomal protein S18 acetylase RimI-like enzyme|nr:GNAT family N-acetyltransferase [Streptococcaceae bacterium]